MPSRKADLEEFAHAVTNSSALRQEGPIDIENA